MNIAAGFLICGIYPFNPSAISISDGIVSSDITSAEATNDSRNSPLGESESFTAEQEHLFRKCHEESFDVFTGREYVRWVEINHLQSLPIANDNLSLSDYFSSVPVAVDLPAGSSTTTNHGPSGATDKSLSPTALTHSARDTSTALTPSARDASTARTLSFTSSAGDASTALTPSARDASTACTLSFTPSAGDASTALTPSSRDTSTALTPSARNTSTALTPVSLPVSLPVPETLPLLSLPMQTCAVESLRCKERSG